MTQLKKPVRSLAYSPDGRRLATLAYDSLVHLYDPANGDVERTLRGEGEDVLALAFRPDGSALALAGRYGNAARAGVSTFDLASSRAGPRLPWQRDPITELAYSADGRSLVACGPSTNRDGGVARRWDFGPGQSAVGHYALPMVLSMALSGDGHRLAVGSHGGVYLCGPGDRAVLRVEAGEFVHSVAFGPDDRLLAAAAGRLVHVWEAGPRRAVVRLSGHEGEVRCVRFAPDGRSLATGAADGGVKFWDAAAWRERAHFDWGLGAVHALAFAPDGLTLAAGGDGGVLVVDAETV